MNSCSLGYLPLALAALSGVTLAQTWTPVGTPGPFFFDVLVDPTDPDHLVLSTANAPQETYDAGISWGAIPGPATTGYPTGQLQFDSRGSLMILGGWLGAPPPPGGQRVLIRSGTAWLPFGPSFASTSAERIQQVIRGTANDDLIAVDAYQAFDFGHGRIYLSDDGGSTWTDTGPAVQYGVELHIVESLAEPYLVRVSDGSDKANSRQYVERSSGWSGIDQTLLSALDERLTFGFNARHPESMWAIISDPFAGTPASIQRSSDSGATFQPTGSSSNTEFLFTHPLRPEWLLRFDSGQYETSTDGGETWSFLAAPPVAGTFSGNAFLSDDGRYIYAWYPTWPSIFRMEVNPFIGTQECSAEINASGLPGRIRALGSLSVAENVIDLVADQMPPGQFGFFITSQTPGFTQHPAGSYGNLCLSGTLGRYIHLIQNSGAHGTFEGRIDLAGMPVTLQPVAAQVGETWRFQAWFRDQLAGQQGSNFTDAIALTLVQ